MHTHGADEACGMPHLAKSLNRVVVDGQVALRTLGSKQACVVRRAVRHAVWRREEGNKARSRLAHGRRIGEPTRTCMKTTRKELAWIG